MAEFYDGFGFDMSGLSIRYGKQQGKPRYEEIAQLQDKRIRDKKVDELVKEFIKNKDKTGFFAPDDPIYINKMFGKVFTIDDNEIYHTFFDNLNANFSSREGRSSGGIVMRSVYKTVLDYYGRFDGDQKKRYQLTSSSFDDEDNFIIPSIKNLKGQNSAACVEYASLAHNLWLLAGVTSHYILSKDTNFPGSSEGHAFVIVEYGEKFRLFDIAQEIGGPLNGNPIKDIQNSKPLVVNNMVYANASKAKNLSQDSGK